MMLLTMLLPFVHTGLDGGERNEGTNTKFFGLVCHMGQVMWMDIPGLIDFCFAFCTLCLDVLASSSLDSYPFDLKFCIF